MQTTVYLGQCSNSNSVGGFVNFDTTRSGKADDTRHACDVKSKIKTLYEPISREFACVLRSRVLACDLNPHSSGKPSSPTRTSGGLEESLPDSANSFMDRRMCYSK